MTKCFPLNLGTADYILLKNQHKVNVAIIGLGRVGSTFIEKLSEFKKRGVNIVAVIENSPDSPGLKFARQNRILVCHDLSEITEMKNRVDVIFNLTGNPAVERDMRLAQVKLGNNHTIIVSRAMAALLWKMISEESLPAHTSPVT